SDAFRMQGRAALLAQTLVLETFSALYLGRGDVTNVASAEAGRFATETEQPVWTACAMLGQANLASLRGQRQDAERGAGTLEQVALLTGNRSLLNGVQLVRGLAALGSDAPEDAFAPLARMMDPADQAHHVPQWVCALDRFADAAALAGRVDDGRRVLRRFEALTRTTDAP